ncbi:MAG: DUF2877 domain-containing protein, partial [Caldisericota bacterium]|nr:DUF2877 domain-containing protein [Caldisericota bacterium]
MHTVVSESRVLVVRTLGTAFPEPPFRCTVHSVYPSAVNLVDGPDGHLFTLLSDESLAHPMAATVRHANGGTVQFDTLGLKRGVSACADDKALVFDGGLSVLFEGARRTDPSEETPPDGLAWDLDAVAACGRQLSVLQEAAGTALRWEDLSSRRSDGETFVRRFRGGALALADAFAVRSLCAAIDAAMTLIGLGPGLTPAGDDFLCGFSLAAYVRTKLSEDTPRHVPLSFVEEWLKQLLGQAGGDVSRTGAVSLSFLFLAQRGLFSRALVALAGAFTSEEPARMHRCTEALTVLGRLGHSSGYDAATGFLFGLEPS